MVCRDQIIHSSKEFWNRKVDKFIKWSIEQKGYLKYKELIEYQEKYKNK